MKLYLWKNVNADSDFLNTENIRMPCGSSDCHSGGIVVLANDINEAVELIKKYTNGFDISKDIENIAAPVIIDLEKSGVVIYCSGDC
jgi:hypothetical protein